MDQPVATRYLDVHGAAARLEISAPKAAVAFKAGFMTIQQVSELLCIPKRTLYEWVNQRRIPYYKMGGTLLRFRVDEIEGWASDQHREKKTF